MGNLCLESSRLVVLKYIMSRLDTYTKVVFALNE